jgi:hypothetical protein
LQFCVLALCSLWESPPRLMLERKRNCLNDFLSRSVSAESLPWHKGLLRKMFYCSWNSHLSPIWSQIKVKTHRQVVVELVVEKWPIFILMYFIVIDERLLETKTKLRQTFFDISNKWTR